MVAKTSFFQRRFDMAGTAIGFAIGASAASTVVNVIEQKKAAKRQEQAIRQQQAAADEYNAQAAREAELLRQQMAENARQSEVLQEKRMADMQERSVAKQAGSERVLSQSEQAAQAGPASTMLTGPMGVDPTQLQLGKSTLLGG
jgi:uncharacterized membrane protein YqiK